MSKNIIEYRGIIISKYPQFPEVEISLPKYVLTLTPWKSWLEDRTPKWWTSYNNVKHERSIHFKEANLENVLYATAGLCVLVSYLYHDEIISRIKGFTPMFMFLDRKYRTGEVKVLTHNAFKLPDF